jgi:cytoskeletal protein RodZ
VSIGDSLATARRQAGLTITQVSLQTRIRESIIRGIEQNDFSACGGDFYARGHIRNIAEAVGTDPEPLIREYDAEHGPPHAMRAADVFEPSRPIKIRERRSPSLSLIVVVVLLAIIGYSSYRYVDSHHHSGPAAAGGATTSPSATTHATTSPHPSPTISVTPTANGVVIELTAVHSCWVQLTSSTDGTQLYMGTIQAGTSMTWTEKEAVELRLGNPGYVFLTVNGKKEPPSSVNTQGGAPVTLSFAPADQTS